MTQHKPALSDAERQILISGNLLPVGLSLDRLEGFARNVEQAVLSKLTEQKPVVYRFLRPSTKQYVYITDNVPTIKEFEPLYLAPTLPLEPSDELIAEIKAMADIRLVDRRVELSNVKEIIHAIVHHPIYAN